MNPEIYAHLHTGDHDRAQELLARGVRAETARNLAELDLDDRWEVFQLIENKEALAVFLHMDDEEQANLLETMGLDEARKLANHLPIYTLARTHELLPWVMLKIGVDHAPGADPFITNIKDFSGLAVYFLMAVWLLGLTV